LHGEIAARMGVMEKQGEEVEEVEEVEGGDLQHHRRHGHSEGKLDMHDNLCFVNDINI